MSSPAAQQLIFEGEPRTFVAGDSALIALLRHGVHPTGGGCLCLAGDCPHCLATVDGVAYTRTCQAAAKPGMRIERHPQDGLPPLPAGEGRGSPVAARHLFCDVVVIGQGEAGRAAAAEARLSGCEVVTLDAGEGQEVIGLYPGPLVVARTAEGMLQVHPRREIVVATGAAEIQPVAPGNHLAGIVTLRAAKELQRAGVDLGKVLNLDPAAASALLRFEGAARLEAVVLRAADGGERRVPCDTAVVNFGLAPRDALLRMGRGLPVRAVGEAARPLDVPACPQEGTVCPCSRVTAADLRDAHGRGFTELELLKRATLAGTGPCQGAVCMPHLRSFLAAQGRALPPPMTARPVARQPTLGEVAAGAFHQATPKTALDAEHRRLGAKMERLGGWWRPWSYGDLGAEVRAVREGVSICDVSTLGKMVVSGPGALELLERLYPVRVASLKPGRSRYALLFDDRGYLLDDGLICRESESRFTLTFTSGGATFAELWVRDWAESWGLDVRLLNQTFSRGAINVTGPRATELLARAGLSQPLTFLAHREERIAGVACRAYRLSFTGEVSYELHHAAADSVALWRSLLELGRDLAIRPHGLEALLLLRLEKGHLIVGQDSDFDATPRRLGLEWAVQLDKGEFVGKAAILRTNSIPLDRQLVGLELEGAAPAEGAVIRHEGVYAGSLTSSGFSETLGKAVALGWLRLFEGVLPEEVEIDGRPARRVPTPFYDPEGRRARA